MHFESWFICGNDILLADIYGACEIEQSFVIVVKLLSFYEICKSFNVLKWACNKYLLN